MSEEMPASDEVECIGAASLSETSTGNETNPFANPSPLLRSLLFEGMFRALIYLTNHHAWPSLWARLDGDLPLAPRWLLASWIS